MSSAVVDEQIVADFKDQIAIKNLASKCDILTYEIELANSSALKELEMGKHEIHPSSRILHIIQNKHRQKTYLKQKKIPVPEFDIIDGNTKLKNLVTKFGFPLLVKACEDSYDGRGNTLYVLEMTYLSGTTKVIEKNTWSNATLNLERNYP